MVLVCVVGCGTLGLKVAGALGYFGHNVQVWDRDRAVLELAQQRLRLDRFSLRREGLLSPLKPNFDGRISFMTSLEGAASNAKFVFECVVEDVAVKEQVFSRLSNVCGEDAILASCTLHLPIANLSAKVKYPERVLGVRFLYPVYYIPEVEITLGPATSRPTIDSVIQFLTHMGMTPFFRCGSEPLVLNTEQRDQRLRRQRQRLAEAGSGVGSIEKPSNPELAFVENRVPAADSPAEGGNARDCAVCLDEPRDCVMNPCRHLCTCSKCAKILKERGDKCPICRQPIQDFIRVYIS